MRVLVTQFACQLFKSNLHELSGLPGYPTLKANKHLYKWPENQRYKMKKAIKSCEQNDSPVDCDDIVEYLRDRQVRLENVCKELSNKLC